MARNRKHQSAAVRFVPGLWCVLGVIVIAAVSVGFVWHKRQIQDLGRQIRDGEIKLEKLREANGKLGRQLMTLRSPQFLDKRIKELNLGLVQPAPSQLLRLVELPMETATPVPAPPPPLYAARQTGRSDR